MESFDCSVTEMVKEQRKPKQSLSGEEQSGKRQSKQRKRERREVKEVAGQVSGDQPRSPNTQKKLEPTPQAAKGPRDRGLGQQKPEEREAWSE